MANSALPAELKEAGWKIERKVINDDEEHPLFVVTNERLAVSTGNCSSLDEAIEGAVLLHFRSEGKKVSRKEIKRFVAEHSREDAKESEEFTAHRDLKLSEIRIDGGTQPRGALREETIADYTDEMKRGAIFPEVVVFFDGKHHWLADGFHRYFATKRVRPNAPLSKITLAATIHEGTQRDAILFSVGANARHGLPRSNEDKRLAVKTLLLDDEWSKWSDGAIASKVGVSQPFVSSLRREMTSTTQNVLSEGGVTHLGARAAKAPQPTKRIGKDKVARETKAIGKKKPEVRSQRSEVATPNGPRVEEYPAGWFEQQITINLLSKPGTMSKRPLIVSGKVGEADPVFLTFTSNDLNPMPPALAELHTQLLKAYKRLIGKASSAKGGRK